MAAKGWWKRKATETEPAPSERKPPRRSRRRRVIGLLVRLLLLLVFLPLVATLVYAVLPAVSTPMLARLVTGQSVERIWTPLDAIAPRLAHTVVTSEDARFCQHDGVDWDALMAQVEKLEEGESVRGASTIPMQLAKNLFLWPSRSYVRKALEIPLALWIDLVLPKRRILELYLNVAEWGEGVFGVEAAARRYFGKSADALTADEAALLATALPNPIVRNAGRPSRGHAARARTIRRRSAGAEAWVDCL